MKPYSNDLRRKIVAAYEIGDHSLAEVAELFGVSLATVKNLLRRQRQTGCADALPHAGGRKPALNEQARTSVRAALKENNDLTLAELRRLIKGKHKKEVSLPTMSRLLQALGLPRKKSRERASERDTPRVKRARRSYRREVSRMDFKRCRFIDESGVNLAMTRLYARAPRGERAVGSVPVNYGSNLTIIGALGMSGVEALMTVEGATDGDIFRAYVTRVLAPTLRRGDVVVMDNLRAHKVSGICEAIEARGAKLLYLPPYSPDLSPIERCWSKVKTALRSAGARTRRALEGALKKALSTITESDAVAWFAHCGYGLN